MKEGSRVFVTKKSLAISIVGGFIVTSVAQFISHETFEGMPEGLPRSIKGSAFCKSWERAKAEYIAAGWVELLSDDFENGWGNWVDGGRDAKLSSRCAFGNQCLNIQDNSGKSSSFWMADSMNLIGYSELKIEFVYLPCSMDSLNEGFHVQLSHDGGVSWETLRSYRKHVDFENPARNFMALSIESDGFTSNMKIRFLCDASSNWDDIYIDDIRISALSVEGVAYPVDPARTAQQ